MNSESLHLSNKRNYLGSNMAWTKEQTLSFQMDNKQHLEEINKTLQPDKNLNGKVGIFAPGQLGDLATCMSILKYRDIIFPNKEIIWYVNYPNADLLRYAPISEVRPWPWAGAGLPEGTPDFYPLLCDENNKLNKELAKSYELTSDLEDGYFPCAWMMSVEKRHGLEYPNISKKIFGVHNGWDWHPVLAFSNEELDKASEFMHDALFFPCIAIETFAGSGQSLLEDIQVRKSMEICSDILGECYFIFMSHKYLNGNENFPEDILVDKHNLFACDFTVRQGALIVDLCDILISVSSGITVASSCWGNSLVPVLQFTGSLVCSTKCIALGKYELVTHDNRPLEEAQEEYYSKLRLLLNEIK